MHPYRSTLTVSALVLSVAAAAPVLASDYEITITNLTRGVHFTPLIAAAHDKNIRMFHAGMEASSELQAIAEGGDIQSMNDLLVGFGSDVAAGDGLLAPGASVTLMLEDVAAVNSVLSISGMLLPTNDGFVGIDSAALPSGNGESVTLFARGYDAGTEANDELVGSGAPGVAGFPAPPPVVATGTGVGGTGINTVPEGYVHVHPGVLGDLDPSGGISDINAVVHRWQNPVARVVITNQGGEQGGVGGVSSVANLSGTVYSETALELFWDRASSDETSIVGYRIERDGRALLNLDGISYFDQGLSADTTYSYSVSAIDANGLVGQATDIQLTTNAR